MIYLSLIIEKLVILSPFDFEWNSANNRYLGLYRDEIASLAEKKGSLCKGNFIEKLGEQPPEDLVLSVKEKHRLWYDYWRPANWKCLFGDDSKRIFSNAAEGLPSFKEEWQLFPKLISNAEANIRQIKKHSITLSKKNRFS